MKLTKNVFFSKYLNKKHSVSSLFAGAILICASLIVFLITLHLFPFQKPYNLTLLLAALIPAIIILVLAGIIIRAKKEVHNLPDFTTDADENNQINDLQNEKKYFARVLSHDLRSPLSSIILLSSYLKTKIENPETAQYIEMIEQSARKDLNMMATLLCLMRAGSFNQDESEDLNLSEIVESLIKESESLLSEKQIKTNLNILSDMQVFMEPQALKLVLKTLFSYALHHSVPGQTLEITSAETNNRVKIEVGFQCLDFDKNSQEQLFSSDHLVSQNGMKGFPEHIDLYFCQKAISNYGTIHVIADKEVCRLILELDKASPQN